MNAQADLDAILVTDWSACPLVESEPNQGDIARMDSTKVLDQLDSLIDDLLNQSDLPASSLASMLMAARDSVKDGYHVALARRVWDVSHAIRDQYSGGPGPRRSSALACPPE